jgi:limonene-1,2-epoxide hydrolase
VPIVTIFEIEGDHIRRSADYYDVAGILGQLGLLDMGEATPAP